MNKNEMITKITRTAGKYTFKLRKHSPEILVVAGVIGTVVSTVMACKATTKAGDILDETKTNIDMIHDCEADQGLIESGRYSHEDARRDLTIVYTKTAVKFAKLYGPSIAVGAISIASILASNNILRKRNVALGAAYAALDKGFKDYRSRVVERFGEAVDRELRYNIKAQKIEEKVVDEETGKEKKVKKNIEVVDPNEISDYARMYDCGNIGWTKSPESNLFFLRAEQNYANDLLKSRGYLFLNEVYDRLGFPKTKAGQIVGWIYDPSNSDGEKRDNYVSFGIYNTYKTENANFVNGYEKSILLDFNVDGPILDLLETHQR